MLEYRGFIRVLKSLAREPVRGKRRCSVVDDPNRQYFLCCEYPNLLPKWFRDDRRGIRTGIRNIDQTRLLSLEDYVWYL